MSERGVFAVDRGLFEHPSFASEPFTEREAWAWMISEAAWKPTTRRVSSIVIELKRGQLSHSLRWMAGKWQWSEARVRRFLTRLKTDAMIDAATDAGVTVITIKNYGRYQRVSLPTDAPIDAQNDAAATQQRRKEEDTKSIQLIEEEEGGPIPEIRGESKCLVRQEAFDLTKPCVEAMGRQANDPIGVGLPYQIHMWLEAGGTVPLILAACARAGPTKGIGYLDKVVRSHIAESKNPQPAYSAPKENRNGSTGNIVEAARRNLENGIDFGPRPQPPGLASSPSPPRLLSQGRS